MNYETSLHLVKISALQKAKSVSAATFGKVPYVE